MLFVGWIDSIFAWGIVYLLSYYSAANLTGFRYISIIQAHK